MNQGYNLGGAATSTPPLQSGNASAGGADANAQGWSEYGPGTTSPSPGQVLTSTEWISPSDARGKVQAKQMEVAQAAGYNTVPRGPQGLPALRSRPEESRMVALPKELTGRLENVLDNQRQELGLLSEKINRRARAEGR